MVDDSVKGTLQDQFNYVGSGWSHCTNCNQSNPVVTYYNASHSGDSTTNDYVTIAFKGTKIAYYGVTAPWMGLAAVSIDGGTAVSVNLYSAAKTGNVLVWTSPALPYGAHTLKIRNTGTKNASSTGTTLSLDRVNITN